MVKFDLERFENVLNIFMGHLEDAGKMEAVETVKTILKVLHHYIVE